MQQVHPGPRRMGTRGPGLTLKEDVRLDRCTAENLVERGAALSKLTDMWLSTWGDEMEENVE